MKVSKSDNVYNFHISEGRRKLWNVELNLLGILEDYCKNNDIDYFLLFGSAIGAVRDKGFIPWDDDIDIGMLREDFEKFIIDAKRVFPDYITVQYGISDGRVDYLCRIRDSRTTGITYEERNYSGAKGAFIEIYVFDFVVDNWIRNVQIRLSASAANCMNAFFSNEHEVHGKASIQRFIAKTLGVKTVWSVYRFICKLQSSRKHQLVDTITLPFYAKTRHHLFYAEDVATTIATKFENINTRLPRGFDRCLSTRYGNYMEIPPVHERGTHHNTKVFYDPFRPYTDYENSSIPQDFFNGQIELDRI